MGSYIYLAFSFLFLVPSLAGSKSPTLWGDLATGPHKVGYRIYYHQDTSRSWNLTSAVATKDRTGRPVRVSVWYPTREPSDTPGMPFARYVDPPGGEKRFKEVNRALAERDATSLRRILKDETTFLKLLDTPTAAELDGSAAAGPFPILVYSSGLNDTAASGSLLAEYLASHGFVVVSVPQLGSDYGRFSLGVNPVDMETQIRDLEFAAAVVRELPFADRDRLAVGGHSMGGVAALVYQMRHPEVGAIVGLDASYGSRDLKSVLTSSAYYRPGRVRVPLLDLRRADAQVDLSAIDALDFSDRYFLEFSGVAHADFTTFPMIAMRFPTDIQGRTPEAARTAFETTCRYIEHFLDATLRGGQQGKAFLAERPENNGVPKEVVTLRLRRGLAPPPTAVDFAQNVERNGLEEARRLLGAWQKRLPGRDIIEEPALNALGYDFLARARLRLATDLFRLNADAHPASANAYDSLAEGYLAQGDRSSAAQAYEKVLEILATDKGSGRPEDALRKNAKDKLRELKRGR